MTDDTTEERHVKPFADWLVEQRFGNTHAELSAAFNELIEAVNTTGKGGELVLKVKVKPATKGAHAGTVTVADDVTLKKPTGDRAEALFFVDSNCNLTRDNPQQQRLPLREVPGTPAADAANAQEA